MNDDNMSAIDHAKREAEVMWDAYIRDEAVKYADSHRYSTTIGGWLDKEVLDFTSGVKSEAAKEYWQRGMIDSNGAIEIIETLLGYGGIRPIEGVRYPAGTHKEMLDKADLWLWNNRPQNKKKP